MSDNPNTVDLRERVVTCGVFSADERDMILTAVNALYPDDATTVLYDPGSNLGVIESLWAALSISDGGEGICSATLPLLGSTPLVTAKWSNMDKLMRPFAREAGKMANKVVRIVKFNRHEVLQTMRP